MSLVAERKAAIVKTTRVIVRYSGEKIPTAATAKAAAMRPCIERIQLRLVA